MKHLKKGVFSCLIVLFSFSTTSAMDISWDDIIVTSTYSDLENRIEFTATIDENIVPVEDYFIGVEINRTIERARFENNSDVNRLEASFDTRINILKGTYPYTLKVVDARGTEQYTRDGVLSFDLEATGDAQRGLGEVIFPEDIPQVIEEPSTESSSQNTGSTTTTTTTTTIINDQGEVIGEETTTTIITNGGSVNSSTSGSESSQTTIIPKPGAKGIYASQSAEPLKINGIGNNPNYNSWRGQ